MSRPPFATRADIQERHPRDLVVLCADEQTRLPAFDRVDAALADVSSEIRAILARRYTPAQLDLLDEESLGVVKLFAMDMALYRVALGFGRQTEAIKERYELAVRRLEGVATGRGGLTFVQGGVGGEPGLDPQSASPNQILIDVPDRVFSRRTLGSV